MSKSDRKTRGKTNDSDNDNAYADLYAKFTALQLRVDNLEEVCENQDQRIQELEAEVAIGKQVRKTIHDNLDKLRHDNEETYDRTIRNEQYAKRETIEIHGIPTTVLDKKLEDAVIDICEMIGEEVYPEDFQAVHRMPNGKTVVARFISRKQKHNVIRKRVKLDKKRTFRSFTSHGQFTFMNQCLSIM